MILADPDADGAPRVVTLTYRDGTVRLDQFDGELGLGRTVGDIPAEGPADTREALKVVDSLQ